MFLNTDVYTFLPAICPMNKKCSNCHLVNFPDAVACARCQDELIEMRSLGNVGKRRRSGFLVRSFICICVVFAVLLGFYCSLVISAASLTIDQKSSVRGSIKILKDKGFSDQAFLLENVTVYRSNDNWLNASVAKENAYAATNFPFEIMTLYPDFYTYPVDETERAAILLHEAEHLKGKNEHDAYAFVWSHRQQLGWTKDVYGHSPVWLNVRKQTRDNAPELFVCNDKELADCTE